MNARPFASPLTRRLSRIVGSLGDEAGSVIGFVAFSLPLLAILTGFAIDIGHWYDYRRTLQTRADAAALGGGDAYGQTCFASSPSSAGLNAIGSTAVDYSGPGSGSQLPAEYPYASGGPYYNVPNLASASLNEYYVLLNSTKYANDGGSSYSMATVPGAATGSFCNSTDENGQRGPMLDVRVTQENVPLFFKIPFASVPAISAHARVTVQGVRSEVTTPVAVRDAGVTPCVSAIFIDDTTKSPLAVVQGGVTVTSVKLTNANPSASPAVWTNAGAPAQVTMPLAATGHKVSVRTFLNDCSTPTPNGNTYNYDSTNRGLAYIDTYGSSAPLANAAPLITTGGVTLTGGSLGGACDPYFFVTASSGSSCTVGVTAKVAFQPGLNLANTTVTAKNQLTGDTVDLVSGGGTTWATPAGAGLPVAVGSGGNDIEITWKQTSGAIGATACGTGPGNPKPCTGTFGVQQRSVAGYNGENDCVTPTIDSGPNVAVTIGDAGAGTVAGADSFAYGSTSSLVVTAKIAGLSNANTGDPPICLRLDVQNDKVTGIIDCGQGNGASADQDAIKNGCPNPLQVNTRSANAPTCSPALIPADCVPSTPGNRNPVLRAFEDKIDPSGNANTCAADNWLLGNPITLQDPRAYVMVIVSPADLVNLNPNVPIPVRNFAVFYVTGWSDKGQAGDAGCTTASGNAGRNEPFPGPVGQEQKGEVWGQLAQCLHQLRATAPATASRAT